MADAPLPAPFEAYIGDQPFLFASYAHVDGATVFPELTYLHNQGFRIWYDEGIDPGNEWPEEVAKALTGSSYFVVFVSPNAVKSQNVRNEINYALNNRKPFLAIHITETELPPGLQLRMGDIQAIMKYRMVDESYGRKLEKTLPASLKSSEVIDDKELENIRTEEIYQALKRVVNNGEAWKCGLVTIWRADYSSLIITSWSVDWETITPTAAKSYRKSTPAKILSPLADTQLREYSNAFVQCNRILQPDTPLIKLRNAISEIPHFDPPWHTWKHMGAGDVDFECKQCGYDGFSLGHYDSNRTVPTECPKCALGRDMPRDTRKY